MEHNKAHLYRLIALRFIIASIILIINASTFGLSLSAVYYLVICVYVLTVIYLIPLFFKTYSNAINYVQIIFDLIIETALIHYTGGIDSVLNILYPLSSIAASIIISSRAGVITALLGSIFYAGIVSLEFFEIFTIPGDYYFFVERDSTYIFSLLYFRVTVFCIIGFLGAYIAQQLRKKNKQVSSLEAQLRREDRLSAIGKLAASTAHEIRNPLASISGCVEALKESLKLDSEDERLFNLIVKETSRLNNIINGLLEYVRPKKLKLAKTNLTELIDEVVILIKNNKDLSKEVIVSKEHSLDNLVMTCDAQQIKQVFFNIILNAMQAVDDNGRIKIRAEKNVKNGTVRIEIIDNGRGMDKEQMSSLFEPFSSSKEKGLGLGLAIAHSIVTEHAGTIEVESEPKKGSWFSIILPTKPNKI